MKIFRYIILLFTGSLLFSCKKFLDTKPADTLSPEYYYNTEAEMNAALAGVYDPLGQESLYGNAMFTTLNAASDLSFYRRNNVSTGIQVLNFDPSNPDITNLWETLYKGIQRANLVLANIHKPQMSEDTRNAVKGEALFLRGYYYFLLASNWGAVPLVLEPTLSVNKTDIARTPLKEVYQQVLTDMEAAEPLVKDITAIGMGGRVSKSAVRGILARVNLFMAGEPLNDGSRYAVALDWAKKVVNDGSAAHRLNTDYKQIFINYAQDKYDIRESIWEVENWGNRIGNAYLEAGRVGNTNGVQCGDMKEGYAYGFIGVTSKLYKLYEATDVRRDWAIAPYSYSGQTATKVNWTASQIYQRMCGKFRREYELLEKQKNYTPQNFPLLRYADVLLMLAEAENEVNGPSSLAHSVLNQVRARAGAKQYTAANNNLLTTKEAFRKTIQEERARELCFEALRPGDLKRWGIFLQNIKSAAAEITQSAPANFKYAALAGNNADVRHLLYPVPLHEMSLNKALTQNEGW